MMSSSFWVFLIIINIDIAYSITCDANQDCSIDCNTLQPCQNEIITCPTNGKCEIKCEYNSSCKNTTINAEQSSLLNITGCIATDSCLFLSIYCPLYSNNQHPNCYIQGNNNLNEIEIYAMNGWEDIQITHIGNNNSMEHCGIMYCSNDMSTQCIIASNNWLCNDNIHVCDNIISMNNKGPILNEQKNDNHLFTIHFSIEIILIFFGIIILLIVCIIGCCCIYKLHGKYNQKTTKDPMDIIHDINIPVSSVSPQVARASESFGGQIMFGQQTPSVSNNNINNSNLTLNIPSSIAEISVHDIAESYHHKRHAHIIDITHSINESNSNNIYPSKQQHGRASMGTYTPTEIQLAALRNGISSSSLVPPSLNNISSNNSLQISSVHSISPSPKSHVQSIDYNYNKQYLGVNGRNRNCTLSDMHIDLKALPLSPPNTQINVLNMDSENDNQYSNHEGNGSDSDLFIQQKENKTAHEPQPPPVPKHILANYFE